MLLAKPGSARRRDRTADRRPTRAVAFLLLLGAGACGGGPAVNVAPESVGDSSAPLTAEQNAALAAAEKLYRDGDAAFAARRDELAREPATARWLTRLFTRDAVFAFDRRQSSDEDFLRQVAGVDPVWDRALANLRALGSAAAPALIDDLLRHPRHDRRRLGVTLLGATGADSLPALQDLLRSPDPALRRLVVLAVGEMAATPATVQALRTAAGDKEFTVRAAAYQGLGLAGGDGVATLRVALGTESDGFVRRVIARALGNDRSRASAAALLAFLRRSFDAGDKAGADAAHEALARMARLDPRKPRGYEAWAQWVEQLPEQREEQRGTVEDRPR